MKNLFLPIFVIVFLFNCSNITNRKGTKLTLQKQPIENIEQTPIYKKDFKALLKTVKYKVEKEGREKLRRCLKFLKFLSYMSLFKYPYFNKAQPVTTQFLFSFPLNISGFSFGSDFYENDLYVGIVPDVPSGRVQIYTSNGVSLSTLLDPPLFISLLADLAVNQKILVYTAATVMPIPFFYVFNRTDGTLLNSVLNSFSEQSIGIEFLKNDIFYIAGANVTSGKGTISKYNITSFTDNLLLNKTDQNTQAGFDAITLNNKFAYLTTELINETHRGISVFDTEQEIFTNQFSYPISEFSRFTGIKIINNCIFVSSAKLGGSINEGNITVLSLNGTVIDKIVGFNRLTAVSSLENLLYVTENNFPFNQIYVFLISGNCPVNDVPTLNPTKSPTLRPSMNTTLSPTLTPTFNPTERRLPKYNNIHQEDYFSSDYNNYNLIDKKDLPVKNAEQNKQQDLYINIMIILITGILAFITISIIKLILRSRRKKK